MAPIAAVLSSEKVTPTHCPKVSPLLRISTTTQATPYQHDNPSTAARCTRGCASQNVSYSLFDSLPRAMSWCLGVGLGSCRLVRVSTRFRWRGTTALFYAGRFQRFLLAPSLTRVRFCWRLWHSAHHGRGGR